MGFKPGMCAEQGYKYRYYGFGPGGVIDEWHKDLTGKWTAVLRKNEGVYKRVYQEDQLCEKSNFRGITAFQLGSEGTCASAGYTKVIKNSKYAGEKALEFWVKPADTRDWNTA